MTRTRKFLGTLALAAATTTVVSTSSERAFAQEIQLTGPLKGAPAVRHLRLYREGRVELAPMISATILDEFRRTVLVGARINYGVTDWLTIGAWGGFGAIGTPTGLTSQIATKAVVDKSTQGNVPTDNQFGSQVASIKFAMMGQLTAVPFRGKLALFKSLFADVDAYLFAGGGIVGTQERANCDDVTSVNAANPCATNHNMANQTHLAPTWGLGFNFYLNNFMAFGLEYRMIPFAWNRPGFDSRGSDGTSTGSGTGKFPDGKIDASDQTFKFNQMISLYLGFSFPSVPKSTD